MLTQCDKCHTNLQANTPTLTLTIANQLGDRAGLDFCTPCFQELQDFLGRRGTL